MKRNGMSRRKVVVISLAGLTLVAAGWIYHDALSAPPADKETKSQEPPFYDPPDAYDLKAIDADPSYYERVVPSRVWQQAPLAPGKIRHEEIQVVSEGIQFVREKSKLHEPLTVKAKPNRPVTFTALDSGHFANGKLSITVKADEQGYATVDFWVGAAGYFRVLAGSPENHGPAEIILQALTAAQLEELNSGRYVERYWEEFNRSPHARQLQPRSQPANDREESAGSSSAAEND